MTIKGLGDITTDSIISELEPSIVEGFGIALGGVILSLLLLGLGGSEMRKKLKGLLS
jgi:hypothetical protein